MTHRATPFLACMIALAAAATSPALADVYYVTYTGTASGTDTNGVFGTAGAVLSSVAFTSTYTYDPSQFGTAYQNNSSTTAQVYGGADYGTTDPILSATLTINGRAYYQGSSYLGQAFVSGSPGSWRFAENAYSSSGNILYNNGYVSSAIVSLTAVQAYSFGSGAVYGMFNYNGESIALTNTSVSVMDGPPAAVPEPASLALLTVGTAMFGLALATPRTMSRKQNAMLGDGA